MYAHDTQKQCGRWAVVRGSKFEFEKLNTTLLGFVSSSFALHACAEVPRLDELYTVPYSAFFLQVVNQAEPEGTSCTAQAA